MSVKFIPDGYHTITPYLIVADGPRLVQFLTDVFDAKLLMQKQNPDGNMGHTEMLIGDSKIMLSQAMAGYPPHAAMLYIYVPDADATYARALAAGATAATPVATQLYGDRSGGFTEPGGNLIWVATHVEDVSDEEIERRYREAGK